MSRKEKLLGGIVEERRGVAHGDFGSILPWTARKRRTGRDGRPFALRIADGHFEAGEDVAARKTKLLHGHDHPAIW